METVAQGYKISRECDSYKIYCISKHFPWFYHTQISKISQPVSAMGSKFFLNYSMMYTEHQCQSVAEKLEALILRKIETQLTRKKNLFLLHWIC